MPWWLEQGHWNSLRQVQISLPLLINHVNLGKLLGCAVFRLHQLLNGGNNHPFLVGILMRTKGNYVILSTMKVLAK